MRLQKGDGQIPISRDENRLPVIDDKPMIGSVAFTRLGPRRLSRFEHEGQAAIRADR